MGGWVKTSQLRRRSLARRRPCTAFFRQRYQGTAEGLANPRPPFKTTQAEGCVDGGPTGHGRRRCCTQPRDSESASATKGDEGGKQAPPDTCRERLVRARAKSRKQSRRTRRTQQGRPVRALAHRQPNAALTAGPHGRIRETPSLAVPCEAPMAPPRSRIWSVPLVLSRASWRIRAYPGLSGPIQAYPSPEWA